MDWHLLLPLIVWALEKLAARLGEWPLLLTLANGRLRRQMSRGKPLPDALVYLNQALDEAWVGGL